MSVETNVSAAVDLNQALGTMESSSVAAEVAERLMAVFTSGQIV